MPDALPLHVRGAKPSPCMKQKAKPAIPKFFCENCGNEVKRNTKVCPHCGRFFASVKCPECNHIGSTEEFINGCPECGYAFTAESDKPHKNSRNGREKPVPSYTPASDNEPLPWWIYSLVAALAVLLGVCFFKLR